jgi:hypothetical protein
LILTSNRVGTFDEAFKSRIQLTLRYKTLQAPQRLQIWENFINRLHSFHKEDTENSNSSASCFPSSSPAGPHVDYGINSAEIRAKLHDLAKEELNGREIRNAITTARQLALFQKKPLGFTHLESVINEAKKFDVYLTELRKGFTVDYIKKDKGER